MKKIQRIYLKTFALCFLIAAVFTSCLKDTNIEDQKYGMINESAFKVVSLAEALSTPKSVSLEMIDSEQDIKIATITLDAENPAEQDIVVGLSAANSQAAVDDYNNAMTQQEIDEQKDSLSLGRVQFFPTTMYTLPATVTIPRGQRSVDVYVKMNTSQLDPSVPFAIQLELTSVQTTGIELAGDLRRQALIKFVAKNKYDGVYLLSGYHNRVPYNFPYTDIEMHLITLGPNSVAVYWVEAEDYGHPIGVSANSVSWYGNGIAPVFVFGSDDAVTSAYNRPPNTTVISLYTGAGAMANRYDEATKTLYVSWMYNNNPLRAFFDTFVYEGPRP